VERCGTISSQDKTYLWNVVEKNEAHIKRGEATWWGESSTAYLLRHINHTPKHNCVFQLLHTNYKRYTASR